MSPQTTWPQAIGNVCATFASATIKVTLLKPHHAQAKHNLCLFSESPGNSSQDFTNLCSTISILIKMCDTSASPCLCVKVQNCDPDPFLDRETPLLGTLVTFPAGMHVPWLVGSRAHQRLHWRHGSLGKRCGGEDATRPSPCPGLALVITSSPPGSIS